MDFAAYPVSPGNICTGVADCYCSRKLQQKCELACAKQLFSFRANGEAFYFILFYFPVFHTLIDSFIFYVAL